MERPIQSTPRFGAQIWLEPTDTPERIEHLFRMLAQSGMGWARLFLMWPWIEPRPGKWDFSIFDHAFDAAEREGIKIKATLTANSGPWHIGTPSILHSFTGVLEEAQRPAMERYIRHCVERYAKHPARGQWLLWNEPFGRSCRTAHALAEWRKWLRRHFQGDLEPLNQRWRSGYVSFDDIPFPENVPHPEHAGENWNSYGPWLLDWRFRADQIMAELQWISTLVKALDPEAETVINPNQVIANQAANATDLQAMGKVADVLGASFHPAWHFTYARRNEFPALMAAGVRLLRQGNDRVEITEIQFGNTVNSSRRPSAVFPWELQQWLLAGLAAGAEQIIGWCLNARSGDFEAGDWGLLDNADQPSPRSQALLALSRKIGQLEACYGPVSPEEPEVRVIVDPRSQALEWVEAKMGVAVPGRAGDDGAHGAGKMACLLSELGLVTSLTSATRIPDRVPSGTILVVSHLVSMDSVLVSQILRLVEQGATLVIDGSSGRKSHDAVLHRPWPVGFQEIELTATEMESNPEGFALTDHGQAAGTTLLARQRVHATGSSWRPFGSLRFADDGSPAVLRRPIGDGSVLLFRGLLGPSLLYSNDLAPAVRRLFGNLATRMAERPRPAHPQSGTVGLPFRLGRNPAVLFLQSAFSTGVGVGAAPGLSFTSPYLSVSDLWTGQILHRDPFGEICFTPDNGIGLILENLPAGKGDLSHDG